jgi:nucleoside 2-deoxyribosyltransferase
MKIYFAGPLFTPYVRDWISCHAQILRDEGFDPFVPHETLFAEVSVEGRQFLLKNDLLTRQQEASPGVAALVSDLIRQGRVTREQLGLRPTTPEVIFRGDLAGLSSAQAVLALLDGTQVDDGTACELGIFYALMRTDATKKGIIALMTDSRGTRKAETNWGINYFVLGTIGECGRVVAEFQDALAQLRTWRTELDRGEGHE